MARDFPPGQALPQTRYGIGAFRAWSVFLGRSLAQVFAIGAVALMTSWAAVEVYDFAAANWWVDSVDFSVGEPMVQSAVEISVAAPPEAPSAKPLIMDRGFPNYGDLARLDGALMAREIVSENKVWRVILGALAILSAHVVLMRMKSWLDA